MGFHIRIHAPKFVQNVIDTAGKPLGAAIHAVADVTTSIGDAIKKIPFAGPLLHYVYDIGPIGYFAVVDQVAQGKSIDQVAMGRLKQVVSDYKEVAPYVQTVIGFVPGVGPVVSGAIGAGAALAQGQPISEVMIAAARGAIPGGALAQAAFDIGKNAVQGKPITQAAVAGLIGASGVQLPSQAAQAISSAMAVTQQLASGKKLAQAVIDQANDLVSKHIPGVPANMQKYVKDAMSVGTALAQGQKLQNVIKSKAGDIVNNLASQAQSTAMSDPTIAAARGMVQEGLRGFDAGVAYMKHQADGYSLETLRDSLSPAEKKAFDMATALHVGQFLAPPPPAPLPPKQVITTKQPTVIYSKADSRSAAVKRVAKGTVLNLAGNGKGVADAAPPAPGHYPTMLFPLAGGGSGSGFIASTDYTPNLNSDSGDYVALFSPTNIYKEPSSKSVIVKTLKKDGKLRIVGAGRPDTVPPAAGHFPTMLFPILGGGWIKSTDYGKPHPAPAQAAYYIGAGMAGHPGKAAVVQTVAASSPAAAAGLAAHASAARRWFDPILEALGLKTRAA